MSLFRDIPDLVERHPLRVTFLDAQWVFERRAEGVRVVVVAGDVLFRGWLGVGFPATLALRGYAPPGRIEILPNEPWILAPGGRLRGWVALPLCCDLVAGGRTPDSGALVRVAAPELRSGWREGIGYFHRVETSLRAHARAAPLAPLHCQCRLRLYNRSDRPVRVERVAASLDAAPLVEIAGRAIGPRLVWEGEGTVRVEAPPRPKRRWRVLAPGSRSYGERVS